MIPRASCLLQPKPCASQAASQLLAAGLMTQTLAGGTSCRQAYEQRHQTRITWALYAAGGGASHYPTLQSSTLPCQVPLTHWVDIKPPRTVSWLPKARPGLHVYLAGMGAQVAGVHDCRARSWSTCSLNAMECAQA